MRCILMVPGIGIVITEGLGRVHIVFNAITPLHAKPVKAGLYAPKVKTTEGISTAVNMRM